MMFWLGIFLGLWPAFAEGRKIICLAPSACEWTAEILLEQNKLSDLVATVEYANHPDQIRSLEKVGAYTRLNLEKIVTLKPTHVVASKDGNQPEQIQRLTRMGVRVHVMDFLKIHNVKIQAKSLMEFLGEFRAEKLLDRWDHELEKVDRAFGLKKDSSAQKIEAVAIVVGCSPLVLAGGKTFYQEAVEFMGFENAVKDSAPLYPRWSRERFQKENPKFTIEVLMSTDAKPCFPGRERNFVVNGDDFSSVNFRFLKSLQSLAGKISASEAIRR